MELLTEPSTSTVEASKASSYTNPQVVVKQANDETESSSSSAETEGVDDSTTYEGVASDDFADFTGELMPIMQGVSASLFVVIWALFFIAGIMAVQTLLKSLEPK